MGSLLCDADATGEVAVSGGPIEPVGTMEAAEVVVSSRPERLVDEINGAVDNMGTRGSVVSRLERLVNGVDVAVGIGNGVKNPNDGGKIVLVGAGVETPKDDGKMVLPDAGAVTVNMVFRSGRPIVETTVSEIDVALEDIDLVLPLPLSSV